MEIYLKLLGLGLIIALASVVLYLIKRKTRFDKLSKTYQHIIIGVIFGLLSIMGTEFGVPVEGVTANVRDAAPICAGLIFGAPAGIIAGIIGGVERFLAAYWGRGFYTQIACSVSTIFAGFFAAFMRKYLLENQRPSFLFAFFTGLVAEVVHLTFIFITHLSESQTAIKIVEIVTLPMVFATSVTAAIAALFVDITSKEIHKKRVKEVRISKVFQRWLLIIVFISYAATTTFVYAIQTNTATLNVIDSLKVGLNDATSDLSFAFVDDVYATSDDAIFGVLSTRRVGDKGYFVAYKTDGTEVYKGGTSLSFSDINNKYSLYKYYKIEVDGKEYCIMAVEYSSYYIIGTILAKDAFANRDAAIYINTFMEIIIFALLFIALFFLIKRLIVDNVKRVNSSLQKITNGYLETRVDVSGTVEFNELARDINKTVVALEGYIEEAASRIDKELALARDIQTSSLPSVFPPFPKIKKYDLFATMTTAKEVGGDFYDFYMVGDNKIAFLIADVSGKGIPAAMFMMQAKTLIKSLAEEELAVDEILTEANKKLCENNEAEMFVTVWMGILDTDTGRVNFASAGHNPPLLYRYNEGFEYYRSKPGFVLAGLPTVKYKAYFLTLNPGDRLFLYTDGVTEATDKENNLYGEDRLKEYLNSHANDENHKLLHGIKEDIDIFTKGREQFDDITMLVLDAKASKKEIMKTFKAEKEEFENVTSFVSGILENAGCDAKLLMNMELAVEEIFVNIASYAYTDGGTVDVAVDVDNNNAIIKFIDSGVEFNPLAKDDPDITLSASERKIGGLGIFMVKKLVDDIAYEYKNGKNILSITKKIK